MPRHRPELGGDDAAGNASRGRTDPNRRIWSVSDAKSGAKVASSGEPLIEEAVRNNLKFGSNVLLKNGPTSASFSFMFGLFKQTIQFLEQINVKNGFEPTTFQT